MDYLYKNIWPIIKKDCISILAFLGTIATINEIFTIFKIDIPQVILIISLIVGMLLIIIINKPKKEYVFNIKGRDIKIILKVGDILKEKFAMVVPTNTTFDTKMENDFISIHSVQGQVQDKYFKNNISTLDYLIEKELENRPFVELEDRKNSKNKKYEIGTTIEINQNGKRFYFLADSDINSKGKSINPSMMNITDALSRLWQYIGEFGHVEPIVIPIIGTGRMGIVSSREEIFKNIIFSFVANNTTKKIATELIVYIRKEDIKKYNIDINELIEYMKFICKYQYEKLDNIKSGTGIE